MSKPVIVIRKLEDSPEWLDRRLVAAYLKTVYQVIFSPGGKGESITADLHPGRPHSPRFGHWLEERNCGVCSIVTACNPASVRLSAEENARNNQKLASDLRKASRLVLPATNLDPDGRWPPEESFCACGIAAGDAAQLGRKYGQNAVIGWEKGGIPELWWL